MLDKYTPHAKRVVTKSDAIARMMGHASTGLEHVVLAIAELGDEDPAARLLAARGITLDAATAQLVALAGHQPPVQRGMALADSFKNVLMAAKRVAEESDVAVTPAVLLSLVVANPSARLTALLAAFGTTALDIASDLEASGIAAAPTEEAVAEPVAATTAPAPAKPLGRVLSEVGTDMTELAREGRLDPVVGRDAEIERMVEVLCRRGKNNPVLIGEPGVGKTAVVEGLAQRIASGYVPEQLREARLISLDLGSLQAGTRSRGDLEERVKKLLAECEASTTPLILFIDEIHSLVGAGGAGSGPGVSEMLKPALARGDMPGLIGATTLSEYKQVEKDAALERRFTPIIVNEPDRAAALEIARRARANLSEHHGVEYTDDAVVSAVDFGSKYLTGRNQPDVALDLLDEAGAAASMARSSMDGELRDIAVARAKARTALIAAIKAEDFETAEGLAALIADKTVELATSGVAEIDLVDVAKVAAVVSTWSGVPAHTMTADEVEALRDLPATLSGAVIGQDAAVEQLAKAARRRRVGVDAHTRPASFLFAGPTGVGKSELAKVFTRTLYGSDDALIQVDMGEFAEPHSVSRLLGAPPGYVGYDAGSPIAERIRRHPHSVLLLDEVEKAHPLVFDSLLQILEEGKLTLGDGTVVPTNFLTIIMTTNLGAAAAAKPATGFGLVDEDGFDHAKAEMETRAALKNFFRPELLNRIDAVITFKGLGRHDIEQIASIMIARVVEAASARGITVAVEDSALAALAKVGYDKVYGARPMRRAITNHVEDLLAEAMLSGTLRAGTAATVSANPAYTSGGDQPLLALTVAVADAAPVEMAVEDAA